MDAKITQELNDICNIPNVKRNNPCRYSNIFDIARESITLSCRETQKQ